ncbi:hypothetical protein BKA66DRAFT_557793 [Pyrenochaeta sp. MPI-SDFR-AT-0127]|nr:hypothetical protein BKA66DRAFT_557793 [Pyrenochaeta sp. MPI-SDFR-AT-0127]
MAAVVRLDERAPEMTETIIMLQDALQNFLEQLRLLELQLRSRGQWKPPRQRSNVPVPTILDMSDLSSAIDLLTHIVTSTQPHRQMTPQTSLSAYSWKWDPEWKEFYTYLPERQTYVYLSKWKFNEARNIWEHVDMAHQALAPDTAVEVLGAWEDWTWDPIWGEWFLEMKGEEGDDGRCCIFASRWHVQDDGEWVHVVRFRDAD